MKKRICTYTMLFLFMLCINTTCYSQALVGEVSKAEYKKNNRPQVVDAISGLPVENAVVTIPTEGKFDYTDNEGHFKITPSSSKPVILAVQKDGFRPFSLTLRDGKLKAGLIMQLSKKDPLSIIVSDNLLHLGDNSYSENSSGACLINAPCVGPSFSKDFYVGKINPQTKAYVTIGSVIGIDTLQAMKLGQNNLTTATSTPMEIFVNRSKVGELKINGDNQKIPIPTKFLKAASKNVLTIKTGINKDTKDYIDYDDVELMNLVVDIK